MTYNCESCNGTGENRVPRTLPEARVTSGGRCEHGVPWGECAITKCLAVARALARCVTPSVPTPPAPPATVRTCPSCNGTGHEQCARCECVDATVRVWCREEPSPASASLDYLCDRCLAIELARGVVVAVEPSTQPRVAGAALCFRFPTCDVLGTHCEDGPVVTLARIGEFESWSPVQAMEIAAALVAAARFAAQKPKTEGMENDE